MSKAIKIYDDDPEVYARTTSIKAHISKAEIDGVFTRFGIKDVWWRYDPTNGNVFVKFMLSEKFGDEYKNIIVFLEPHPIWHEDKHGESINWNVTMRNLYWYIYTHLSQAYVNQSSKFQEFLPHILSKDGRKLIEIVKEQYQALPEIKPMNEKEPSQESSWK